MSAISQKQIMILLVVVAALLAAIVGILVWQNNSGPSQVTTTEGAPADGGSAGATSTPGMPPANTTPPAEFDPETAPKVAKDQTPEEYVNNYYQLCSDGKYEEAFKLLPTATQAYYGDEAGFKTTLEGYGISGFEVSPQTEAGDAITVVGTQQAQGMAFPYTWTFVKGDDGSWLCQSRAMGGGQ